jgi:hypothetical protein
MSMCPICGGFDGHLATCPRTEYDDEELQLQGFLAKGADNLGERRSHIEPGDRDEIQRSVDD